MVVTGAFRGTITQNLWRINAGGGEPVQLTDLPHAQQARCSPDTEWVAFVSSTGLVRVRTGGGPVEFLDSALPIAAPAWSPDSRTIVILAEHATPAGRKLVFVSPGAPKRYLDAPADADEVTFTPDGSAVSYLARKAGTLSIFTQPLDGSAPRVTAAQGDADGAQVSPDGSTVAVQRSRTDSDVVLLRDGAVTGR